MRMPRYIVAFSWYDFRNLHKKLPLSSQWKKIILQIQNHAEMKTNKGFLFKKLGFLIKKPGFLIKKPGFFI